MIIIRFILLPFSLLYQLILRLRNYLYDTGIFGITSFDIPTIGVGNLAFGGTGKTPHVEYLIRLLKPYYKVGLLSRGYKRKSVGYVYAEPNMNAEIIGDEPWQVHSKFDELAVAVCENRVLGIPNLLFDAPETQLVLLDDVFQHRALKPGINILLTDYNRRFPTDFLAPMGMLREYRSAYKRADIIIVSKCPPELSLKERQSIMGEINPLPHQQVLFSYLLFGALKGLYEPLEIPNIKSILAFAGIANPQSLVQELEKRYKTVILKKFSDHYSYKFRDLDELIYLFNKIEVSEKIMVTTEKDRTRLMKPEMKLMLEKLPIFYLPVEVAFFEEDKEKFDQQILDYVKKHSGND